MDVGAAELLGGDLLTGGGFHERRAAEKDRAGVLDDDRFVGHGRHIGAAGGARAHDRGDLRNAFRRHARLVEEDPAEVIAVGKDLGLQRQKRAAGVHEVDARQAVLQRDLLRADVLPHRDRVVGAALDGRVVGDDHDIASRDAADARDDAGRGRFVLVHAPGGQRRELEKRSARIEQLFDALAHRELALLAMTLHVLGAAPLPHGGEALAVLGDERAHALAVGLELRAVGVDVSLEDVHVDYADFRRITQKFDPQIAQITQILFLISFTNLPVIAPGRAQAATHQSRSKTNLRNLRNLRIPGSA